MIGGLVEIAEQDRHLSIYRGFLKVSDIHNEIGRVPLDDITALILSSHQITLSKQVLTELAERGAIIVSCGSNYHPLSITQPFSNNYQSSGILNNQISTSEPLKKGLWQLIVRRKIVNQATILDSYAGNEKVIKDLLVLSRRVRSGDPENMEAQAARIYWRALMGNAFRRDRYASGANAALNYGYTVLRAATARAICGAGLHPSLGIHHRSSVNAFALVDDLMEPFRPLVDSLVRKIYRGTLHGQGNEYEIENEPDLNPENKRELAKVLQLDLMTESGMSPLANCLVRTAQSFCRCLEEKKRQLELGELVMGNQLI